MSDDKFTPREERIFKVLWLTLWLGIGSLIFWGTR